MMIPGLVPFLLALALAPQERTYILGELRVDELVWELGLEVRSGEVRTTVLYDDMSRWSLGQSLEGFAGAEGEVAFELPDLGRVEGFFEEGRLEGLVTLGDGRVGALELVTVEPPRVRSEELSIERGEVTLGATLGLPAGAGPFPAVVFVHGGGNSSRDRPATRFLSEYLPRFGIACLVYDKRGNGASTGDWRTVGFDARAGDVNACVRLLAERDDIDTEKIGIYAGSQGCWVASLAATREPRIAFIVNHSGAAVPPVEADTYATLTSLQRGGADERASESGLAAWQATVDSIRAGGTPSSTSWWNGWYPLVLDHDPLPALNELEIPMLWLFGARDTQSDPVRNVTLLSTLARDRRKDYTIHVFPGAEHGIMVPTDEAGNGRPPMTMATGYFQILVDWIQDVTADG